MTEENWSDTDLLSYIVDFILKNKFLYDYPNVKFLSNNLWERIPRNWLEYLEKLNNEELNLFPFQKPTPYCPETLLEFHVASNEIFIHQSNSCLAAVLPDNLSQFGTPLIQGNSCMTVKKRHEIENFTVLLMAYCKLYGINRIVDVGCGVGHLIKELSRHCKVVGIDCNEKFCQRARKSCAYAEIICLTIICDGTEDQKLLEFLSGDEHDRTAVVSLHGCGDLQPTLLRHFCKLDRNRVPLIFTIPCCYHKMSNLKKEMFHWAMSNEIKQRSISCEVLPVSALRLACQKHISSWPSSDKDRKKHTKDFISRALLECLYDKHKDLLPTCRKLNCRFEDVKDTGVKLASQLGLSENAVLQTDRLYRMIYTDQEPYFAYVEPFTLLQTMMQTPLEMFVLLDRLFFLREHGYSAYILSVFNPKISSRHLCIIASSS
uniref:Methyltranfer_dom domain-containing protein n=2 Tax=Wuchereria bancrofti TaxID=6293 RepID=A0A1I8EL64_WUCBA